MTQQQREQALNFESQSTLYERQGKIKEALECAEKALAIRLEYLNTPNDTNLQREIALCYKRCSRLHEKLQNAMEALEYAEKALAVRREHLNTPADANLRRELALSYERCGHLYEQLNNLDMALKYFEIAQTIRQDTSINENPSGSRSDRLIGKIQRITIFPSRYRNIYITVLATLSLMIQFFIWTNISFQELIPSSIEAFKELINLSSRMIGDLYTNTNNLFARHPIIPTILSIIATGIFSAHTLRKIRVLLLKNKFSDIKYNKYNFASYSVIMLTFIVVIYASLYIPYYYDQRASTLEDISRDVVKYTQNGDKYHDRGNWYVAYANYLPALSAIEKLAELDPHNVEWQRELMNIYIKLSEAAPTAGLANQLLESAMNIGEKLEDKGPLTPRDILFLRRLPTSNPY